MNKTIAAFLALLVITISGCVNTDYALRLSEKQIQEKLYSKLPLTKKYLIFQMTLDNPRVNLASGSNRVRAGLDVFLNIQAWNEVKPLAGTLDVSGGIKYVPERGEFFLTDPVIERVLVQDVPDKFKDKINGS
jgi:hypothetical protein